MKSIVFDNRIFWQTDTQCFSAEVSDLRELSGNEKEFALVHNGKKIVFKHYKTDTDGEDVYGWNFKAVSGHTKPCKFLLIND